VKIDRKALARQKHFTPEPLPESLAEAFEAVENLDAMHPASRGQTFGAVLNAETFTGIAGKSISGSNDSLAGLP
jgi:hypothetical protein